MPFKPTSACIVAALVLAATGCAERREARPRARKTTAVLTLKPDARPPASTGLDPLVRRVLARCKVTPYGAVRGCDGAPLRALSRQEQRAGAAAALLHHCRALDHKDPRVRGLAAARVEALARPGRVNRVRSPALVECLMGALSGTHARVVGPAAARAVALLGAAARTEGPVVKALAASPHAPVRAAGFGGLWALGRARVLPVLRPLVQGTAQPTSVRVAVLQGLTLGAPWSSDERRALCSMLSPLMSSPQLRVAATAAGLVATRCPGHGGRVVAAAEAVMKRGELDLTYVNAVAALERARLSPALRQRVAELLTGVVTGAYPALVRAAALRNLHQLDPVAGAALARQHRLDSSHFVVSTAKKILGR